MARAEAYLHAKFHLDPSNRLATIHQRHRQTDRQTVAQQTERRAARLSAAEAHSSDGRKFAVSVRLAGGNVAVNLPLGRDINDESRRDRPTNADVISARGRRRFYTDQYDDRPDRRRDLINSAAERSVSGLEKSRLATGCAVLYCGYGGGRKNSVNSARCRQATSAGGR